MKRMAVHFYCDEKQRNTKTEKRNSRGKMWWKLVFWWLSCRKHHLCDRPRQYVTCGSPSRTGVVLGGAGLADGWFHHTPLGWGLSLSLHLFGKLSLLYHSYIVRGHTAIDKSRDTRINSERQLC